MRVPQEPSVRGSQRWMQLLVNEHRESLDSLVSLAAGAPAGTRFDWKSPLGSDGMAEYRDASFLERVGLADHAADLDAFWPTRGPQWDALATGPDGMVVLVEAKSYEDELMSRCRAADEVALDKIGRALSEVRQQLGVSADPAIVAAWTERHYQYANRLAHLRFLRARGVPAQLVFLYFANDATVREPLTAEEWPHAIALVHAALGLPAEQVLEGVHSVVLDVAPLGGGGAGAGG